MTRTLLFSSIKATGFFLIVIGIFLAGLVIVNSIPDDPVREHVKNSFSHQDYSFSLNGTRRMDHFSECVAVTMGISDSAKRMDVLTKSLLNPTLFDCNNAKRALIDSQKNVGTNYWRYWHGYQLISRPVLYLSDVYGLRTVSFILFCVSFILFFSAVRTYIGFDMAVVSAVSLFAVPLYSQLYLIHMSLVWSMAFLLAALVLRLAHDRKEILDRCYLWLFFLAGMLTAYVDLLSNPLVTLTIPLVVMYWSGRRPEAINKYSSLRTLLLISTAWSVGFVSSWGAKWILAAFVIDASVFDAILDQINFRLSGSVEWIEDLSASNSIYNNLVASAHGLVLVAIALIVATMRFAYRGCRIGWEMFSYEFSVVFFGIFLMPFAWLAILRNHSLVHDWMVSPILYPSFALLLGGLWRISSINRVRVKIPE